MRVYICDKFTVYFSDLTKLSTLELLVVVCDQFLFLMLCKATLSLFFLSVWNKKYISYEMYSLYIKFRLIFILMLLTSFILV